MKSKAYFARAVSQFGNRQDERDIATLEDHGWEVHDIISEDIQRRYEKEGMAMFEEMVANSDALFFRAFPDGKIGAGVWKEIQWAKKYNVVVFELPTILSDRVLSVEDTRTMLYILGAR